MDSRVPRWQVQTRVVPRAGPAPPASSLLPGGAWGAGGGAAPWTQFLGEPPQARPGPAPPLWLPPGWHRLLSGLGLMENLGSFLSSASTTTHPLCIKRAHVSPGEGGLGSVGWHSGGGRVCGQSRAGKLQEQLRPPLSRTSSEEPLGWPWVQGLGSSGPGDGHGQPAGSQRYTRGGPSQSGDSALSCPFSVMLTSRACPHCPPSSSVPAWEASWEAGTAQGGQLC